jgi:hypothetical protein
MSGLRWDKARKRIRAWQARNEPQRIIPITPDESFWKAWRDDTRGMRTLRELQAKHMTLRGMAAELTRRKIATPRGGKWHPQTVRQVLDRLDAA